MKKYLVKMTHTATEDSKYYDKGYTESWYVGKENSDREFCDYIKEKGWSRKHFAEKYIRDDKDFHKRMNDTYWKIDYEIVEVEL